LAVAGKVSSRDGGGEGGRELHTQAVFTLNKLHTGDYGDSARNCGMSLPVHAFRCFLTKFQCISNKRNPHIEFIQQQHRLSSEAVYNTLLVG
jgi:hypothetical protein